MVNSSSSVDGGFAPDAVKIPNFQMGGNRWVRLPNPGFPPTTAKTFEHVSRRISAYR